MKIQDDKNKITIQKLQLLLVQVCSFAISSANNSINAYSLAFMVLDDT